MSRFGKLQRPGAAPANPGATPAPAVPPAPAETSEADSYPEHYQQGDAHFYNGNFREALRSYSRAVSMDSAQVGAWAGQVRSLLALRQLREATTWARQALQHFPEDPVLVSENARVLARNGDVKRAIAASDFALSRVANADCWVARGDVLLVAGDGNARSCFERAIGHGAADDWRTPHRIMLACMEARRHATGLEFARIATQRAPSHAHTWRLYAELLRELNYTDQARDALAHAEQLDPRSPILAEMRHRLEDRSLLQRLLGSLRRS